MKCSLGISNFLEEISSLSHSVVFLYFFALIAEEGFLISPCYSLELYIQMPYYALWTPHHDFWSFFPCILLSSCSFFIHITVLSPIYLFQLNNTTHDFFHTGIPSLWMLSSSSSLLLTSNLLLQESLPWYPGLGNFCLLYTWVVP